MQLFTVEKIKKRNIRKTLIHSMVLQSSYRDEQSLLHGSKFLDLNQPGKKNEKNWHVRLSCAWYLGKKMVTHTFHLSLDNANHFKNDCWVSETFATVVTWHHTSSLTLHTSSHTSSLNSMFQWNRINDYFYFVGGNSWESWCNHFWTHGIHVI